MCYAHSIDGNQENVLVKGALPLEAQFQVSLMALRMSGMF